MKGAIKITFLVILFFGVTLYIWLGYEIEKGQQVIANGDNDYVIILGAKVKQGGVPSLSLKNRLDVAATYLKEHQHVMVIVSGGQGHDEDRTEASVMYDYLIEKGIAAERILLEEQSTSTYENILFSKALLPQNTHTITIISNDFHLRRAIYIAKTLELEADAIAAKTPASVRLKSNIRERLALLKAFIFKN